MHEVIICEKPKSSEKIAKALSPKAKKFRYNKKITYWKVEEGDKLTTVLSAAGHLYSLTPDNPKDKMFFDLHWAPLHEIDKKNKKYIKDYINAVKKFSKDADTFVHACDYDIEGTLIGYNTLKYACGEHSLENVSRMKFSTLTQSDILEAYNNRIDIDINQVDSGIARHTLDFMFGVNISKALMSSVRAAKKRFLKLSAGRVQTPTLSILVDREKEIEKFIPEPFWLIKAVLENEIIADHIEGRIFDKERAEKIFNICQGADATVSNISVKETIRKPPLPFNLGSLQSEAYGVFGFSPKKTQVIAQNLYIEGFTSYPRTSSEKLPKSLDFKKIFKDLSGNKSFKQHIDSLKNKTKPNEGKKEDAAHPAIHPTGVLPDKLTDDDRKIYELIVYRFISVFGENSKLETMKTMLNVSDEKFTFSKKRVSYMGWLEHYPFRKIEDDKFPNIKEGDLIGIKEILSEEKETKPPSRYNEASLIKELEKRGLGTKATRADIVAKLYDRKYIAGKKIEVNKLGENIIDTLSEYCSNITSEELTRHIELNLDGIINNENTKESVIDGAKEEVLTILSDIEKNEENIGTKLYDAYQESRIVGECSCGGNLLKKYSPKNKSHFVGCSNYPNCGVAYSLPYGANFLKKTCKTCGLPMISYGSPRQHACLDQNCGKEGKVKAAPEVVGKCPECGEPLLKRSGRYGEFVGCKGFPKCRFTCSLEELAVMNKKPVD